MAKRPKILEVLGRIEHPAADEALVAGLLFVDSDLQSRLVDMLFDRGHTVGLEALAQLYDKLGDESRGRIVGRASRLFSALRTCIRGPEVQTRLNTLQIIRASENLRLAYLAALAMHDGAAKVRAEAAITLLGLSERYSATYAETTTALRETADHDAAVMKPVVETLKMLREERRYLLSALRDALESYESHHRPEILDATMIHADELEDALFKNSTLKRGKLTHAMLEILGDVFTEGSAPRSGGSASYASFIYVALRYPELRRRVTALLSNHPDLDFFVEFIRRGWLARDPGNRRHLIAVRVLAWLGDGFEPAFTLPPDAAVMLPGWVGAFGLPSEQKVAILQNFLLIDNPEANRAAIWGLIQIHTPASTIALQGALEHDCPSVRRMAEYEIAHRRRLEHRQVQHARNDRPAEWAQLLKRVGLNEEFEDLWRNFEGLQPAQAQLAGRFAPEFIDGWSLQVQNKLMDPLPSERLRAVRLVGSLRLADRFRRDLFSLANDAIAEVRAAAMSALAGVGEATSRRILERGLSDDSPAVQAAAIEALDGMGALKNPATLLPKTDSEDAGVRAAAIRALLKMHVPQSAIALVTMMHDPRVEHRCTALWIVDQMRLSAVSSRVRDLAEHDKDPRVARTAQQVLRRLIRRPAERAADSLEQVAT